MRSFTGSLFALTVALGVVVVVGAVVAPPLWLLEVPEEQAVAVKIMDNDINVTTAFFMVFLPFVHTFRYT
jgi:hypothetical protein